ncbi:metal-dependent phosphohydrolase [Marivibrio halodurans]|uniref:Metal-dependent phosphohydrolase n=1 Tax=Marivibrio halodurans TaxID=2039722 RepID=A0A8J7S444_9PROT|nr:phosphonate degradation HD-domain oxygenase [Marivibrio halodurans]MBP5856404.1 metal-dependent phosphohydrolase [Marivibrio halodurans]
MTAPTTNRETGIRDTLPSDPDRVTAVTAVDFILALFAQAGGRDYLGEVVSQQEHALQCAVCADQEDAPPPLVAASLLHDVGHYLHDCAEDAAAQGLDSRHEQAGADFLARFFPPEVSEPVRLHVDAKRYLCAVEPDYFDRLSEASVHSLNLQGGPMSPAEVAAFEANPHHRAAVRLRRWDETGKVEGLRTPAPEDFRALLAGLVRPVGADGR